VDEDVAFLLKKKKKDKEKTHLIIFYSMRILLLSAPLDLVSIFFFFSPNEKLYIIEPHFFVNEYAYLIVDKCLVFIFAYMAFVKYRSMLVMARYLT